MNVHILSKISAAAAALTLVAGMSMSANAANVTIQVNGQVVTFSQAPIERVGHVYVPLRGVFEKLGASVVYANRLINAQGNGHSVSLRIGANSATVDGNTVGLESPAFIVGSSTLVPLRFVAQALGATVNYNSSNRVVDISSSGAVANNGGGNTGNTGGNTGGTTSGSVTLTNLSPADGAVIAAAAPTVSGNFSQDVDPNSVHILLDGRDITGSSSTYVGSNSFQVSLPTIPSGQHKITVKGNAAAGGAFSQSFSFHSGADVNKPFVSNVQINGVNAVSGQAVPTSYTLTGSTIPNATVQVIIGYQTSLFGGLIPLGGNTAQQIVTADGSGHFSVGIDSSTIGSPQQYTVAIVAINRDTKATSQPVQYNVHM